MDDLGETMKRMQMSLDRRQTWGLGDGDDCAAERPRPSIGQIIVVGESEGTQALGAVLTQLRRTSATLHAWAMQPRGVNGASASKISLMEPIPASVR
jgi:hypothetical protein